MDGNKILEAITKMAQDNNQGLLMSTTLADNVRFVKQGAIVSFGVIDEIGKDVEAQIVTGGLVGDYMAVAFFINRKELEKYK